MIAPHSRGMDNSTHSPEVLVEVEPRKPRTLVLCFDGTSNEFSKRNTNVVKLYSILKKDTPESQLCYYQAGIGTYFPPGVVRPLFRFAARVLDEAVAWYLSEHIMNGYKFLMQNYHEGDTVCIFGFSRGAYTARALAGMLHKVGLLSKDNLEQIPFAYKLYASSSYRNNELAIRFKKAFSREVPIEFLGVWDTVASVGILSRRTLPFVGANSMIKVFRQALSLDECRAKFSPNLYHRPASTPVTRSSRTEPLYKSMLCALGIRKGLKQNPDTPYATLDTNKYTSHRKLSGFKTNVKEVWFAGSHSDVGGGLAKDTEEYALSNIPLRWMLREIVKAQCGVHFDETALELWHIPITTIIEPVTVTREASDSTIYKDESEGQEETLDNYRASSVAAREVNASTSTSTIGSIRRRKVTRTPSQSSYIAESLDVMDAVQKMGNALVQNIFWWTLEVIPTYHEWQNDQGQWVGKLSIHLGRGRMVPSHPSFHESVRTRRGELNYSPKAQYEEGTEEYVL
ncbi:hypothetical protein BJV74DRAFT_149377 [Russula compacta]|nr:hypothetical protein BJV74DRAFT_149377 [Russula compacta]